MDSFKAETFTWAKHRLWQVLFSQCVYRCTGTFQNAERYFDSIVNSLVTASSRVYFALLKSALGTIIPFIIVLAQGGHLRSLTHCSFVESHSHAGTFWTAPSAWQLSRRLHLLEFLCTLSEGRRTSSGGCILRWRCRGLLSVLFSSLDVAIAPISHLPHSTALCSHRHVICLVYRRPGNY